MWVGSDVYESPDWFVEEVRTCGGASKRIPGVGMARALSEEDANAVIFLAHDCGDETQCPDCTGDVDCGSCRVLSHKIDKWRAEARQVEARAEPGEELPRGKQRIIDIRHQRIAAAQAKQKKCVWCKGAGTYRGGTGGYVIKRDGSRMPYRTYNYWMRQPKKFDAEKEIASFHMCATCSGTGKQPHAAIFAFFAPEIEYIRSGREREVELEHIEPFMQLSRSQVQKEPERLAGKRKPGYYAVSRPSGVRRADEVVTALKALGLDVRDREVVGGFISLMKPLPVADMRRFRGVKRFPLSALVPTSRVDAAG